MGELIPAQGLKNDSQNNKQARTAIAFAPYP